MVKIEQSRLNLFNSSLKILDKYFDVWEDEYTTNVYKRRFKNKILQYLSYLLDFRPVGRIDFNSSTSTLDIYGDVKTFMEAATEIEQLGMKVIIHY